MNEDEPLPNTFHKQSFKPLTFLPDCGIDTFPRFVRPFLGFNPHIPQFLLMNLRRGEGLSQPPRNDTTGRRRNAQTRNDQREDERVPRLSPFDPYDAGIQHFVDFHHDKTLRAKTIAYAKNTNIKNSLKPFISTSLHNRLPGNQ